MVMFLIGAISGIAFCFIVNALVRLIGVKKAPADPLDGIDTFQKALAMGDIVAEESRAHQAFEKPDDAK